MGRWGRGERCGRLAQSRRRVLPPRPQARLPSGKPNTPGRAGGSASRCCPRRPRSYWLALPRFRLCSRGCEYPDAGRPQLVTKPTQPAGPGHVRLHADSAEEPPPGSLKHRRRSPGSRPASRLALGWGLDQSRLVWWSPAERVIAQSLGKRAQTKDAFLDSTSLSRHRRTEVVIGTMFGTGDWCRRPVRRATSTFFEYSKVSLFVSPVGSGPAAAPAPHEFLPRSVFRRVAGRKRN